MTTPTWARETAAFFASFMKKKDINRAIILVVHVLLVASKMSRPRHFLRPNVVAHGGRGRRRHSVPSIDDASIELPDRDIEAALERTLSSETTDLSPTSTGDGDAPPALEFARQASAYHEPDLVGYQRETEMAVRARLNATFMVPFFLPCFKPMCRYRLTLSSVATPPRFG